ncbi:MAG: putative toxin-antitoxin system toxin component, PIN family [Chitinivibrionales bacterium]|nr:putative toxin-antitoxin system toxin component, PIN family [Chitinivibrionales bacterium]
MKVFLDTNVLANGIATRGLCADVIREIMSEHELIISDYVLQELIRTLRYKFHVPEPSITGTVELLHRFSIIATPKDISGVHVRDKNDIPILAAALKYNADVLVTGDRDLLILKKRENLLIISPRGFWELLRQKKD